MLNKSYKQKEHINRIIAKIRMLRREIIIHEIELECIADHYKITKLLDKLEKIIFDNMNIK